MLIWDVVAVVSSFSIVMLFIIDIVMLCSAPVHVIIVIITLVLAKVMLSVVHVWPSHCWFWVGMGIIVLFCFVLFLLICDFVPLDKVWASGCISSIV